MRREIDVLIDTFTWTQAKTIKQQNIIKSYVKNNWTFTYNILENLYDLDYVNCCKQHGCWWFPNLERTYMFNREFNIKQVLDIILREYTEQLIKGCENYCNQTQILITDTYIQINNRAPTKTDKYLQKKHIEEKKNAYD